MKTTNALRLVFSNEVYATCQQICVGSVSNPLSLALSLSLCLIKDSVHVQRIRFSFSVTELMVV